MSAVSEGPCSPRDHAASSSVSFADPTRHGTHLPHDSLRKNLTAFSAMSSMHARSSQTTTAPEPTVEPAFCIAAQSIGKSRDVAGKYPAAGPDGANALIV